MAQLVCSNDLPGKNALPLYLTPMAQPGEYPQIAFRHAVVESPPSPFEGFQSIPEEEAMNLPDNRLKGREARMLKGGGNFHSLNLVNP